MMCYIRGQQTFSVQSQVVNVLDFLGHTVSVATTQFCCHSLKITTDHMCKSEHDCSNKSVFVDTEIYILYNFTYHEILFF